MTINFFFLMDNVHTCLRNSQKSTISWLFYSANHYFHITMGFMGFKGIGCWTALCWWRANGGLISGTFPSRSRAGGLLLLPVVSPMVFLEPSIPSRLGPLGSRFRRGFVWLRFALGKLIRTSFSFHQCPCYIINKFACSQFSPYIIF